MEKIKETLIFCFDGTCNDPEDVENYVEDLSITNILKLHVLFGGNLRSESKNQTYSGAITTKDGLHQQSFYYPGVGTYGWWLRKHCNTAFAPKHVFSDVKKILKKAFKDLNDHYPKDSRVDRHVLVFGFSRGAALARMFAAGARERSKDKDLKIDFLGVFDTVAAITSIRRGLGIDFSPETKPSSSVVNEEPNIKDYVQKVVHLVALDENRTAFQPTLFNQDGSDRITEVWFPGVHSDVGGGYCHDGLSDLALEYMVKKVKQECKEYTKIQDSKEVEYNKQITRDDINRKALVNGTLHKHKRRATSMATAIITGIVAGIATYAIAGVIANVIVGTIVGVIVGTIVGVVVGKKVGKMICKTLDPRQVRIAGNPPKKEHPMVHKSVQDRYKEVRGYRPHALRDVKYFLNTDNKQIGEPRRGVSALGMEQKTKFTGTK